MAIQILYKKPKPVHIFNLHSLAYLTQTPRNIVYKKNPTLN